jgi:hypothetical protein
VSENLKQRPLRRPNYICEDNIKMDLTEVGYDGVDWSHLVPDRIQWWAVVDMIKNLWVL